MPHVNSGKEMWLREMRALPPGQALDALAHTILRLEDRIRTLECAGIAQHESGGMASADVDENPTPCVELTGVSWWGFGTIRVKL